MDPRGTASSTALPGLECLFLSPQPVTAHSWWGRVVSINGKEPFTSAIKKSQTSRPARSDSPGTVPLALPEMPLGNGVSSRSGQNQKLQEGTETKSFAFYRK